MPLNTRLAAPELALPARGRRAGRPPLLRRARRDCAPRLHPRTAGLEELVFQKHKPLPPPEDDDGLLLVYTSGTTGKPKGALLTHANCFWTNLSFDRVAGLSGEDTVLQVLPQFHVGGWNVQPLLAWWKGATVVLEPAFDPARALAADRREARDDDDGRSRDVPLHGAGSRVRDGRPLDAAARGRRRRADARGAARDLARARRRDRPGLRADRGGAERALPAARGRGAQARLRRQAVPARRRRPARPRERPPARRVGRGRAARQGAERLRRLLAQHGGDRRPPSPTAGCSPATSRRATTRATTGSSGGRRTWSSRAARTSTRPRSRTSSTSTRRCRRPRSSACPDERWGEACLAFVVLGGEATEEELLEHCRVAAGALQGAAGRPLRRVAAAERARQGRQVGAAGARPMKAADRTRRAHAPEAARVGRADLRRARLPRRLDREDHRGRGRRPGHLLPLLLEQEGGLRRGRARPERRASATR